jgi:hypothetical protein
MRVPAAGVCNVFLVFEPLRGWRHVTVSARRTRISWAYCINDLVDLCEPVPERHRAYPLDALIFCQGTP